MSNNWNFIENGQKAQHINEDKILAVHSLGEFFAP